MQLKRLCPERIDDLYENKYPNEEDTATKEIAELGKFRGFKRLTDYIAFENEQSYNAMKLLDKFDMEYGTKVAIEMTKIEERQKVIDYIRDKIVEGEKV